MTPQQIKDFIDAMAASDLQEMEVSHAGWTLRLSRQARDDMASAAPAAASMATAAVPAAAAARAPAAAPAAPQAAPEVLSPMFGVVHLRPAPDAAPFVQVGDTVEPGQALCTIEAMKIFNEVRAEHGGRLAAVLVDGGAEVEAGQPLFRIDPLPGASHV